MIAFLARLLRRDARGSVLVELALAIPVLILLFLGGFEVARLFLLDQKLDRASASMGDLVSQAEGLSANDLPDIFAAVGRVLEPFDLGARGVVIVTSVSGVAGAPPTINWQRSGGGTLTAGSAIGLEGEDAQMPSAFPMRPAENVIVAEVIYDFAPFIFPSVVGDKRLYHRAFFRPRFSPLTELDP